MTAPLTQAIPRLERIHAAACVRADVGGKALADRLNRLTAGAN
jgi:hypothetical protein